MIARQIALCVAVASVGFASSAVAQVKEKTFKDWGVYTTTLQGKKTCYLVSYPKKKNGNYTRRDEPYFLVTRLSSNLSQVSTSSGYKYKSGSGVKVNIDGANYKFSTDNEHAWARDDNQDREIVKKLKAGNTLTIKGTSIKGTYSIDKYSLNGITAAYDYMHKLCGS